MFFIDLSRVRDPVLQKIAPKVPIPPPPFKATFCESRITVIVHKSGILDNPIHVNPTLSRTNMLTEMSHRRIIITIF